MNKTLKNAMLLPNGQERRQIFYWLKQESSWTAWNRILGYYQAWAAATEASVREASKRGWDAHTGVPESDYRLILKGLAHCDEGVRRLRVGDKRVFKYDANGEFAMALRPEDHWSTMLWRLEVGESSIDHERTPHWEAFKRTLTELNQAWGECSVDILESDDPTDPAPNIYGVWFRENLPKMHFPAELAEVPDPVDNVLVRTGKRIPCSGIWEPVDLPQPKGFNLFRDTPPPKGTLPIIGCMNYLHEGSPAPRAKQETETESLRADVTWRLLWQDDRYTNGIIPFEEQGYVFRMPEDATAPAAPAERSPALRLVYADTGEPAPQGGRWLVEHDIHAFISIQQGEPLPKHQGESVRWVLADTW